MRKQSGAAPEEKNIIPLVRDRIPPGGRRRRKGRKSGLLGRRRKDSASKYFDRTLPISQNDCGGADPTSSWRTADLAFQHAMQSAIAQGLEHPPMIGVAKDARPINPPRLFEPVPHTSGCTSPALECAEPEWDDGTEPGRPGAAGACIDSPD